MSSMHEVPILPPRLEMLLLYWQSLASGAVPERRAIDPAAIKSLLPYIYIVEFEDDPFRIRFRLSGSRVDELNGRSVTGHYLDSFKDHNGSNAHVTACYLKCQQSGEPCIGSYVWPTRAGVQSTVSFALLPLKVDSQIRQCISIEDWDSTVFTDYWTPREHQQSRQ